QHNMEYVEIDKTTIQSSAANTVPEDLMRKYTILPLGQDNGKLRLAIHDPFDFEMLDILRFRLNREIKPVLATKSNIAAMMDQIAQLNQTISSGSSIDKTIDRMRESLDRSMDRSLDRSMDRSMDRSVDKSMDKSVDRSIDLAGMGEDASANDPTQAPIIKLVQAMIA